MALRPIDNALPAISERPKKQVKVSVPVQKQANDENKAPMPVQPISDVTIDYISSEDLKPVSDPGFKIQDVVDGLDSKDWTKICESLNDARRFAVHHSSFLLPFLEKVLLVLVKAMKNPRSAMCKTSIMAASDIFTAFADNLLDFASDAFDNLILQLLLKASQDKKFVCEEADRALSAMVMSITPQLLLHRLKSYVSHSNLRIRAKAGMCIAKCVSKMELEGIKGYGLVSLVQIAADLLNDKLPEAREAARSLVVPIYEAYTENEEQKHELWQDFCQSSLPVINAQAMIKITSSQ